MINKLRIAGAVLLLGASPVYAEGVAGVSYSRLSLDNLGENFDIFLVSGAVGYRYDAGEGIYFTPQVRFGTGVTDETLLGVNIEIDSFYGIDLRAEFEASNVYAFVAPSYTKYEVTASVPTFSTGTNEWEFGVGIGGGVRLGETGALELAYENIDDADVISLSFRLHF